MGVLVDGCDNDSANTNHNEKNKNCQNKIIFESPIVIWFIIKYYHLKIFWHLTVYDV